MEQPSISPSLLEGIPIPPEDWIPLKPFLLGIGPPWEPYPWDPRYNDAEEETCLLKASQQVEESTAAAAVSTIVATTTNVAATTSPKSCIHARWGPRQSSSDITSIWRAGVPAKTQATTNWSLSVWKEWAEERLRSIEGSDELLHKLDLDFTKMQPET